MSTKMRWIALLVAALMMFIWAISNASAQPERRGSTTIRLGGIFPQYNAPSAVSLPILHGYQLAFAQANATGGINGRKVQYFTADDGYDPSQTVPALRQLVQQDRVFAIAGVFGSDDSNAALPYLEHQKVPFFDPIGGGAAVAHRHWVWQSEPSYGLEGKVIANYMVAKLHVRKVAAIYQVGVNEPEISTMRGILKKHGGSLLALPYHADDTSMGAELSRVRIYRPDMVALLGTLIPTSVFVKTAVANGYTPPRGYFANYPQGDPTWLALTQPYVNGSLVSSYADLTGNNPVARAYRAAIKRYDKGQKYTNYGLYGYFNGTLIIRALKLAGKNLSRSRLQTVLDTRFRNYKSGFTGVLNWTPRYRYGVKQFKIYKIHGSSFDPITGWLNG